MTGNSPTKMRVPTDKGVERYLDLEVILSDLPARFSPHRDLDVAGQRRIAWHVGDSPFDALQARAHASWRSDADRLEFITREGELPGRGGKSRWENIQELAAEIRAGKRAPGGMVYVESDECQLTPIDGTNRLIASLEAGHSEMSAVVLRPITSHRQ